MIEDQPVLETPRAPHALHLWQIAVAFIVGLLLFYLGGNDINSLRGLVVGCAVVGSCVPFINGTLAKLLDWLRNPSPATVHKTAIVLGALAGFYLLATATIQERALVPKMEDECSYVISTQLLAHGRLWMHAHPLADFFEALFVIVKPVYCSIYFPGTAIFFAPSVWLGWPAYILPLIMSGGIIAMLYRVVTELLDGVAGLLAVFWMLGLREFRTFSVMVMSHLPMLLLGLLMIWAWLHWRKGHRLRWAIVLGIFSGWAAITRPADAMAYALPLGVAMLIDLWKGTETGMQLVSGDGRAPETSCVPVSRPRRLVTTGVALLAGAAPFLALQIVFDVGVTGRPFQTPYTYSLYHDQPGAEFGFHRSDPSARPVTTNHVKLAYFEWTKTYIEAHHLPGALLRWIFADSNLGGIHNAYFKIIADNTFPSRLLLIFIPAGLFALRDRRHIVIVASFFAFCFIYFFNPFFLDHYPLVVTPAILVCALLGARSMAGHRRWARRFGVPITMGILALSITSLWEFKSLSISNDLEIMKAKDGMLEFSRISKMNAQLANDVGDGRVLVLFGPRTSSFFEEPVYNVDSADIDSAQIIRAHDLGARNVEIILYYAERQPDRVFYRCDESIGVTDRMGTAKELLERLNRGEPLTTQPSLPRRAAP